MTARPYDVAAYWERRYRDGRGSGAGSRGVAAAYKAAVVNDLIAAEQVESMIDWGCGDGHVLGLLTTDVDYIGVDVSPTIVGETSRLCAHPRRQFHVAPRPGAIVPWSADLCLSMDVLLHLVDPGDLSGYLARLFGMARRFVVIYDTDYDGGQTARHVIRRRWTPHVQLQFPGWQLERQPVDPAEPGFYVWRRRR